MWMTSYVREIKKQFRDTYGFTPDGGTEEEPTFNKIPDGEYPMEIDGKTDYISVKDNRLSCCNFKD